MSTVEQLNRLIADCEQSIARGTDGPLTQAVLRSCKRQLAYHNEAMATHGMTDDEAQKAYYDNYCRKVSN